jgi:enoyl-CoA hydratase
MRDRESLRDLAADGFDLVFPIEGLRDKGVEGHMAFEEEFYLNMCWRWRNIPKPVIAACQGKTIAGGLMLLWVCDLIVAADDALFADPTVGMGVNGVEYHAHGWELGPRKAKELLFTGDWWTAEEAHRLGMVNHVVPRGELHEFTLALAHRIAQRPAMALKLAKESVNQMLEAQGQWNAFRAAFSLQHIAHAHNRVKFGIPVDPGEQASAKS